MEVCGVEVDKHWSTLLPRALFMQRFYHTPRPASADRSEGGGAPRAPSSGPGGRFSRPRREKTRFISSTSHGALGALRCSLRACAPSCGKPGRGKF